MLQLFLLVFFLIQFLLILGVLLFMMFFARPEVPLAGNGTKERRPTAGSTNGAEKPTSGDHAAALHRQSFASLNRPDFDHWHTHLAA